MKTKFFHTVLIIIAALVILSALTTMAMAEGSAEVYIDNGDGVFDPSVDTPCATFDEALATEGESSILLVSGNYLINEEDFSISKMLILIDTDLTVEAGSFSGNVYVEDNSKITVKGGTFNTLLISTVGVIEGGSFNWIEASDAQQLTVSGGYIEGASISDNTDVILSGGKFGSFAKGSFSPFVDEGYVWKQDPSDNSYALVKDIAATVTANGVVTEYANILDAFDAAGAANAATLTLRKNNDLSGFVGLESGSVTLDLAGYTLSAPSEIIKLYGNASLKITDSVGEGRLFADYNTGLSAIGLYGSGDLTVEGGDIYGDGGIYVSDISYSRVNFKGGRIIAQELPAIYVKGGMTTISGGELYSSDAPAIKLSNVTLKVTGGTISGSTDICINIIANVDLTSYPNPENISLECISGFVPSVCIKLPVGWYVFYGDSITTDLYPNVRYSLKYVTPQAEWGTSESSLTSKGLLSEAFDALNLDESIKHVRLISNVSLSSGIAVPGQEFTLDLAGRSIVSDSYTLSLYNDSRLTIIDSVGTGEIATTASGSAPISISGNSELIINGGTFRNYSESNSSDSFRCFPGASSKVVVNGGSFYGSFEVFTDVTLNGGSFIARDDSNFTVGLGGKLTLGNITHESNKVTVELHDGELKVLEELSFSLYIYANDPIEDPSLIQLPKGYTFFDSDGKATASPMKEVTYYIDKDVTPPEVINIDAMRISATEASIEITVSEGGTYYLTLAKDGEAATAPDTSVPGTRYDGFIGIILDDLEAGIKYQGTVLIVDSVGNRSETYSFTVSNNIVIPVTVAGIQITEENAGDVLGDLDGEGATVRYDIKERILTLDSFSFDYEDRDMLGDFSGVIYSKIPITVTLVGESYIYVPLCDDSAPSISAIAFDLSDGECVMDGDGSLTVFGYGDAINISSLSSAGLTVKDNVELMISVSSEGIYISTSADAKLTVEDDARIEINNKDESIYVISIDGEAELIFRDNAYVYTTTDDEEGIYSSSYYSKLTVEGNAVMIIDGDEEGIQVNVVTVKDNAQLTVFGGFSYPAISADDLTVSGGRLIALGGSSNHTITVWEEDGITVTGGELIAISGDTNLSVFSCALNLESYTGTLSPLASTDISGKDLTPYVSTENATYRYFILAPEATSVVFYEDLYGAWLAPTLAVGDYFTLPEEYSGVIPPFHELSAWNADGTVYALGEKMPHTASITLSPVFRPERLTDPVIDLSVHGAITVGTLESGSRGIVFNEYRNVTVEYDGKLTLTGKLSGNRIYVGPGEYDVILCDLHMITDDIYGAITTGNNVTLRLTVEGDVILDGAEYCSAMLLTATTKLTLKLTEGSTLKLIKGANNTGDTLATLNSPPGSDAPKAEIALIADGVDHLLLDTSQDRECVEISAELAEYLRIADYSLLAAHGAEKKIDASYLKSAATCTAPAEYYHYCSECDSACKTTFTVGEPLAHKFGEYVANGDATCTSVGTKSAKCNNCDNTDTKPGDAKLAHSFTDGICTVCGTEDSAPSSLLWLWILLPSLLAVGAGAAVYILVIRKRMV